MAQQKTFKHLLLALCSYLFVGQAFALQPDSLAIQYARLLPDKDQWLQPGDVVKVQLKATPGCRASFWKGIPLHELPLTHAPKGEAGIYQGSYTIQQGDTLSSQFLQVKLEHSEAGELFTFTRTKLRILPADAPAPVLVTKGALPYLKYGLGEDRLGGAKIGYLDAGIRMQVTGKVGRDYRVQLAPTQEAWVPEEVAELEPAGIFKPVSLTTSWSVSSDKDSDYIRIPLEERLPYTSFIETNPTRLVVDIYGATSNTNWITQHQPLKEVSDVAYRQIAKDVFRVYITLKHRQSWGYSVHYAGNRLEVRVRHQPEKKKLKNLTILVDAGHGGTNTGAQGSKGIKEKEVTLAIAKELQKQLLRKKVNVIMTRTTDTTVHNTDRILMGNQLMPHMLVSIHCNSAGNQMVQGTSTFYKHEAFRPLSLSIYQQVLKTKLKPYGNIGSFNFALNAPTEYPNALVETGFISNLEDEEKLLDPKFQKKYAKRIRKGIRDFVKNSR